MKSINLTRGVVAIVDDDDYEHILSLGGWYASDRYAVKKNPESDTGAPMNMHRLVWERANGPIPEGMVIDHKDRNGFNNQKENLRLATSKQNSYNRSGCKDKKIIPSEYKGVRYDDRHNNYQSLIRIDDHLYHIGCFELLRDAAIAYDIKAKEIHKDFVCLNVPDASESEISAVASRMLSPKKRKGTSKYRGVALNKHGAWKVYAYRDSKTFQVGTLEKEEDAALLADFHERENSGEFAKLNFPLATKADYDRVIALVGKRIGASSKMIGVTHRKRRNKWEACIKANGVYTYIGTFSTEKEAGLAYNQRAIELLGNKAKLNTFV